jgi:hypothetical protein
MNKKITTYFLKMLRNKYDKEHAYYTYDDKNYYLSDGYMVYAVKKEEMELNINLFKDKSKPFEKIMNDIKDKNYKEARIKYYIPSKMYGADFIIKVVNDDIETYIAKKFYDFFKQYGLILKIKSKLEPVLCYKTEGGKEVFLGMILPVRHEEE